MSSNYDKNDPRRRRAQREEIRKRRQRQARMRLILVVLALILAAALIFWATSNAQSSDSPQTTTQTPSTTQTPEETTQAPSETTQAPSETTAAPAETTQQTNTGTTVIHIAAAGDLNVTDEVLAANLTPAGYDFTDAFMEVAPVLSNADFSILNFEGLLNGAPYGTEDRSAPPELAQALAAIGVDAVQTANSASIQGGILGLQNTLTNLRGAGLIPIGTFADSSSYKKSGGYTLVEINGVRVALVAFTKGMDGLGLPEGSEDSVNLLYEDYTTDYKTIDKEGISQVLANAAEENPDITIALVHWGSEYNENISTSQENVANYLLSQGADVIIGTHSHLLQAIDYDEEAGTLVAWSLGDFYGNATEAGSNYSVVLDIEITKNNETGLTSVTGFTTTPIYTLKEEQGNLGGHRIVQIEKAIARYESSYIYRPTDAAYSSLQYALTRVGQRIAGS